MNNLSDGCSSFVCHGISMSSVSLDCFQVLALFKSLLITKSFVTHSQASGGSQALILTKSHQHLDHAPGPSTGG